MFASQTKLYLLNNVAKDMSITYQLSKATILSMIGRLNKMMPYFYYFKNGVQDGLKYLNKSRESRKIVSKTDFMVV